MRSNRSETLSVLSVKLIENCRPSLEYHIVFLEIAIDHSMHSFQLSLLVLVAFIFIFDLRTKRILVVSIQQKIKH